MAMIEALEMMFSPIDLLFYILAIWEGYRMSRRVVNQAELASLLER